MDYSIVTISGLPGSGTSTASSKLRTRLNWSYVNAGQIFRVLAKEANMTLNEFGIRAESDPTIDRELDKKMIRYAEKGEPIIMEGRLVGWMTLRNKIPALRVWLEATNSTRADRLSLREGDTQALVNMKMREESELKRYKIFHDIDLQDLSIYDLVINTEFHSADEVVTRIQAGLAGDAKC
ncbi:MAG: cytidylate kinase family protein [Candidatus Latescibacterota bacterium]|mgnify:CR=1 FL=1|nr:cytidylate kinase family protein [Candidatus Latescibacterota bacterium]